MSDTKPTDHASEPAAGRHRGAASSDESGHGDTSAPHGRHRRVQDN